MHFVRCMDAGRRVAFGSDWSVAPATPIEGIYAAVTRRTLDDANPGRLDTGAENNGGAVTACIYDDKPPTLHLTRHIKGMLKPGMLADFVLLDRDLTAIPPETIRDTRILRTVIGGKTVYPVK